MRMPDRKAWKMFTLNITNIRRDIPTGTNMFTLSRRNTDNESAFKYYY